jgi:hypothetical protein
MMTAETYGKTCPSNVEIGGDWSCETLEESPGVEIDSPVEGDSRKRKDKVNVVMTEHTKHLESSVKRGGAQQDVKKSYGKENCTYGDDDENDEEASGMDDKGRKCWTKSAIQRAIIIIIDALR